ncbi:hypothetical protein FRC20_001920 [Serendipita sp. 405]|nr:hypothetical protein FRC20_001920 [Serendipita sp. 405]
MPAQSTPWSSQRSKGTFVSDRLSAPNSRGGSPSQSQKATKSSQTQPQPQSQSPAVQKLQKLITHLQQSASTKPGANVATIGGAKEANDPGCFCLSQAHKLSPYVPLCASCGLILCELNQPYRLCPFKECRQPLLTPHARTALIEQLNEKIASTIMEEEVAKKREEEERRIAAGAFPSLAPSQPTSKAQSPATHKVLSITQKGAVLTTIRRTPPVSTSNLPKADALPPIQRVPAPSNGPAHFKEKTDMGTWESLRSPRHMYVSPPKNEQDNPSKKGRNRRKKGQDDQSTTPKESNRPVINDA